MRIYFLYVYIFFFYILFILLFKYMVCFEKYSDVSIIFRCSFVDILVNFFDFGRKIFSKCELLVFVHSFIFFFLIVINKSRRSVQNYILIICFVGFSWIYTKLLLFIFFFSLKIEIWFNSEDCIFILFFFKWYNFVYDLDFRVYFGIEFIYLRKIK